MNRFVIPGPNPGLVVRGNIDIYSRPIIKNPDGSISTVRSASFQNPTPWTDGRHLEVLIPTAVNGRLVSDAVAWHHFERTRQHLGMFDTPAHATSYAIRLHKQQAKYYLARKAKKMARA